MKILLLVANIILQSIIFVNVIKYINKSDDAHIELSNKGKGVILTLITISNIVLLTVNENLNTYLLLSVGSFYLILVGYIDYKTKSIYSFINYIVGFPLSIIILLNILSARVQVKEFIIGLFFIAILSVIMFTLKIIGSGDVDVFILLYLFLSLVVGAELLPFIAIAEIILSILIGGVMSIVGIIYLYFIKKIKISKNTTFAFAPSIATAGIFLFILM